MGDDDEEPGYDDPDDDFDGDCHYCHGEGWYMVGVDHDCDDGVNGPFDGEVVKCPCCGGTGDAEDCTFW